MSESRPHPEVTSDTRQPQQGHVCVDSRRHVISLQQQGLAAGPAPGAGGSVGRGRVRGTCLPGQQLLLFRFCTVFAGPDTETTKLHQADAGWKCSGFFLPRVVIKSKKTQGRLNQRQRSSGEDAAWYPGRSPTSPDIAQCWLAHHISEEKGGL